MLSSWRTMPETIRSMRSGSTGRLRMATEIERTSFSRSNGARRPERLSDGQLAQLHALEGGEAAAALRAAAAADGSPRRPRTGG